MLREFLQHYARVKDVIRLDDPISHGGNVLEVLARHFKVGQIPVACVGDLCSCRKPVHSGRTIAAARGGIALAASLLRTSGT